MSRRVVIGTPMHDGRCEAEYAYSLVETIRLCTQSGVDVRPVFWPGEALVQKARCHLAEIALKAEADLVFIDADQGWKPQHLLQLLKHPVDVVGGAVVKKTEKESYNVHAKSIDLPIDEPGLIEIDGIGTGFLRLSYKALLALWQNSEPFTDDFGNKLHWMFPVQIEGGRLVGEDIGVCAKLKSLGFKIYVDPGITCDHIGRKKYTGDFFGWLDRGYWAQAILTQKVFKPARKYGERA